MAITSQPRSAGNPLSQNSTSCPNTKSDPVDISQCAEFEELEFKLRLYRIEAVLLGVGSIFRMKCEALKA